MSGGAGVKLSGALAAARSANEALVFVGTATAVEQEGRDRELQVSPKPIPPSGQVRVSVEVENSGKRAGGEVVQLDVHDVECSVKRPSKEQRGFERVILRPGEKQTVTFKLPGERLSFWDVKTHGFIVEPSAFDIMVGASSEDIRLRDRIEVK